MKEAMLIYETVSQFGVPKLQAINGAGKLWTQKDLNALEEQLRPMYEELVRDGSGTIRFKDKTLYIRKKEGDVSRQPTLELRSVDDSAPRPPVEKPVRLAAPPSAGNWGKAFLEEIGRLYASERFQAVLPPEKAMLDLFRNELSSLIDRTPPADLTLLFLMSILLTAEQVSRSQRPHEPRAYAYALSGIERLLSEQGDGPQTPWGQLPEEDTEPPPSWLSRFWAKVTGG